MARRAYEVTGWEARSQRFYKQDYGRAIQKLNDWINRGQPEDVTERPLFKEVRQGHIHAIKQLNLDSRYDPGFFERTPERLRARWRSYYSHEPGKKSREARAKPQKFNFWPDDIDLYALMVDSQKGEVCFGCRQLFKEGEAKGWTAKFGKKNFFWVHRNSECCRKAVENFKAGLRQ